MESLESGCQSLLEETFFHAMNEGIDCAPYSKVLKR